MPAAFFHVDVFASGPLTGNGLAVFLETDGWPAGAMQRLTQEMRQFESIFLSQVTSQGASARVFTVEEELPFAGHPVLGAAAVLHRALAGEVHEREWTLALPRGPIRVRTEAREGHWHVEMDQGIAEVGEALDDGALQPVLVRLGLDSGQLPAGFPARVVSTGLPYLVVPVRGDALAQAAVRGNDLEARLQALGAKFFFVFDVERRELRTWDNLGQVEDVATGSAAGPAAAYLLAQGLAKRMERVTLEQGRFTGRPSRLEVRIDRDGALQVSGQVWPVAHGGLDLDLARLVG